LEQLLGSLIQQLLFQQSTIPKDIIELYNSHIHSNTGPDLQELSTHLKLVVSLFTKVYIVVDALDECDESNRTRTSLLTQLENLEKSVQLLFTSRPLGEIESLRDATQVKIRAQEDDMRKYLSDRIPHEHRLAELCRKHDGLEEEIVNKIISKADGMLV
jgi:ankyrin repeat domain-containing protein 50